MDGPGHSPMDISRRRRRAFQEVETRNYAAQKSFHRYPRSPEGLPDNVPQVLGWRLNLVALSASHNSQYSYSDFVLTDRQLYFTASADTIHVFVPRDVRNTILGEPDLILHLPRSLKATHVGGYISSTIPHGINNMKVGDLGNLEILLVACDDGDVIALYTHLIKHEVQLAMKQDHTTPLVKMMRPYFIQNVGISAWGLAVHKQSRLIAVGSNLKQITVFAPACNEPPKQDYHDGLADSFSQTGIGSKPKLTSSGTGHSGGMEPMPRGGAIPLGTVLVTYSEVESWHDPDWMVSAFLFEARLYLNIVIQVTLPPSSHNIPSLDFTSDGKGDALAVVAADVNGNLWQFNLYNSTMIRLPTMKDEISHNADKMGWGVVAIPPGMIKEEQLPHAALGSWNVKDSWRLKSRLERYHACFDITHSVAEIEHPALRYHPAFGANHFSQAGRPVENCVPCLENDESSDAFFPFDGRAITSAFEDKCMKLLQPNHASFWTFDIWEKEKNALLQADPFLEKDRLANLFAGKLALVRSNSVWPIKAIQKILLKSPEERNRQNEGSFERFMSGQAPFGFLPGAELHQREREPLPRTSSHSAILMCHRSDIHFLPADETLPPTICKGMLRQIMPPNVLDAVGPYDRLCMQVLIPDLSIIVVGTQAGRVALVTPTRMSIHMSEAVTMRVELILPLKKQEDNDRPWTEPLLGVAAAPVWRGERKEVEGEEWKEGRKDVRAKAWRLFLHYMDHTVLTYELFRGGKEELVVL
ncbi:uncharacterized protein PAC_00737 [Phialocephala subalpina]|uniref:Uncharacterized protein n=1 Tax=Phialocephala subalpina TaxID=576137 RepID=A0A1L7WDK4_9HELO|nr:uncharacterized protein PAC_00737 [Phialocephala subalpina]